MNKMLEQALAIAALQEPVENYKLVRTQEQERELRAKRQAALEWDDRLARNRDSDSDWG